MIAAAAAIAAALVPGQATSLQVAAHYWHAERVPVVRQLYPGIASDAIPFNTILGAADEGGCLTADPETCVLYLHPRVINAMSSGFTRAEKMRDRRVNACKVIVHEVGHLYGEQHSTNPRSIMWPHPPLRFGPCDRAFPR